jgi:hypothetical protein
MRKFSPMPNQVFFPSDNQADKFETTNTTLTARPERQLSARLVVANNLPAGLAHGLFAKPGTHDVIVHLTSEAAECSCDSGFSAVPGMMLTSAENNVFKLSATPQNGTSADPCNHLMDEVYFSQTPILYGEHIAAFCLIPSSPGLLAVKNHPFSPDTPNALHEATIAFFQYNPAEFDFKVQLDEGSEYHAVARLIIPSQGVSDAAMETFVENLSLASLHTLAA